MKVYKRRWKKNGNSAAAAAKWKEWKQLGLLTADDTATCFGWQKRQRRAERWHRRECSIATVIGKEESGERVLKVPIVDFVRRMVADPCLKTGRNDESTLAEIEVAHASASMLMPVKQRRKDVSIFDAMKQKTIEIKILLNVFQKKKDEIAALGGLTCNKD
ncbi:hypothetical protein E3N88_14713 [Mikania micrantha]|uniref:Uncharacterized protein n=1 Tax=Mikania micrantha TaxID=192012 RepID=A0A5N6P465_9ASTR|nr:hypothetical protein E3N88_14713 [Mikania micrantha]